MAEEKEIHADDVDETKEDIVLQRSLSTGEEANKVNDEDGHDTVSPLSSPKSSKNSKSRSKSPSAKNGKKKSRRRSTMRKKKKKVKEHTSLFDGKFDGELVENIREGKGRLTFINGDFYDFFYF